MTWAHPQAFLLLLLLPLAFWPLRSSQRGSARLSNLGASLTRASGLSRWAPILLASLRILSLLLLVVALARPQTSQALTRGHTEGIAIQLVLDTSLSMGYTDYSLNNQVISRMDAARHAIQLFVRGDEQHHLPGRTQDLIGLVTFNRYPEVACPLTHSHETLLASLDDLVLGPYTNIGDGLAWGLDRLRKTSPQQKILILLSDGKHNAPDGLDPRAGGKLAADLGIRVYTIGAIGNQAQPSSQPLTRTSAKGLSGSRPPADSVDEEALKRVAALTGGKYFRATDTEGLLAIYREIDQLEKSRIEQTDQVRHDEWFIWFLIPGLVWLCVEQLLAATRFLVVG